MSAARVDDVLEALARWSPGGSPLPEAMAALRQTLGTDLAFSLCISYGPDAHGVRALHQDGMPGAVQRSRELLDEWLGSADERWALYTPRRVERFQRNRLVRVRNYRDLRRGVGGPDVSPAKLGLSPEQEQKMLDNLARGEAVFDYLQAHDMAQLRAIACEGRTMLAWVGVMQDGSFTAAQVRAMQRMMPVLIRTVRWETRLEHSSLAHAALEQTLASIAAPAYLVSPRGAVVSANSAGKKRLARGRLSLLRELDEARRGRLEGRYERLELAVPGAPCHVLLQERLPHASGVAQAALARYDGLTPRERQVLTALLRGYSNRRIAAELGCAERTVEDHVSCLLDKLDVSTRAEAVAQVLEIVRGG